MKRIVLLVVISAAFILSGCAKKAAPEDFSTLTSAMQSVDMVLQTEISRLKQISQIEYVKAGDWDAIRAELTKSSMERIEALYWYALPDGSYYTSEKDRVDANLSDRGYFPELLAGKNVVGYPTVGKTSGLKSIVLAVPIMIDDNVVGILGTSIYLEEFWQFLKDKIQIPDNYDFYAVNSQGITIFDLETKDHLLDEVLQQPVPSLVEAIEEIIISEEGELSYRWDGKRKIAIYLKSPLSDWRYVLSFY